MTLRVTIAADPGIGGAIATLIDGEAGPLWDMPVMQVGENSEVDASGIAAMIRNLIAIHQGAYFAGCIERVRAMPVQGRKQGAQSSMNFGDHYGKVKAVFEVMGIPYTRAEPASWKRRFGLLGQDKDASRILAIKRFPSKAGELKRKRDNGRSDALFLALYHEQTTYG